MFAKISAVPSYLRHIFIFCIKPLYFVARFSLTHPHIISRMVIIIR